MMRLSIARGMAVRQEVRTAKAIQKNCYDFPDGETINSARQAVLCLYVGLNVTGWQKQKSP
jgi:hypothetical protein